MSATGTRAHARFWSSIGRDLDEAARRHDIVLSTADLRDSNGNPIRLYHSERNMLHRARDVADDSAIGTAEGALAADLVTILERLGRVRRAAWELAQ